MRERGGGRWPPTKQSAGPARPQGREPPGHLLRMGCKPVLHQQPWQAFLQHARHDRGRPGPACSNLVIG